MGYLALHTKVWRRRKGPTKTSIPAKLGLDVRHAGWYYQPRMSGLNPRSQELVGPTLVAKPVEPFPGRTTESTVVRLIVPQWSSDAIIRIRFDR